MFYRDAQRMQLPAEYDRGLVAVVMVLVSLGLVMVYSSSIAMAEATRHTGYQPSYFLLRHTLFLAVGAAMAAAAFQVPMRIWQGYAPYLFVMGMALLMIVLGGLAISKFVLVVGWYMHLKFDAKLLTWLFVAGLTVATATITGIWAMFNGWGG